MTDKQPYQLLQKMTYHDFEAHMCMSKHHSRFFYSCVWVSHSPLLIRFLRQVIRSPLASSSAPKPSA